MVDLTERTDIPRRYRVDIDTTNWRVVVALFVELRQDHRRLIAQLDEAYSHAASVEAQCANLTRDFEDLQAAYKKVHTANRTAVYGRIDDIHSGDIDSEKVQ